MILHGLIPARSVERKRGGEAGRHDGSRNRTLCFGRATMSTGIVPWEWEPLSFSVILRPLGLSDKHLWRQYSTVSGAFWGHVLISFIKKEQGLGPIVISPHGDVMTCCRDFARSGISVSRTRRKE